MSSQFILPNFIIIGAVKAATTWVQDQLQDHPGIFVPAPEPHFFSSEFQRGLAWYGEMFDGAQPDQLIGEKSADYFAHPMAPERIADLLPHIPLVVQLRNPVERAYSDYKMLYRRGTVKGPPEAYIKRESEQPRFLNDGLYAKHLSHWFDYFDRRQIKIFLFEDVLAEPEETMHSVCAHIGADPFYSAGTGSKSSNDSKEELLPLGLRKFLAPIKQTVKPLRGNPVFEVVRSIWTEQVDYPKLKPETKDWMRDYYADDVQQLSKLIGRNLDHWLEKKAVAA